MSMDLLASLLQDLLKEVRALRARADADALPRALRPEAAAKLLGCSLKELRRDIRQGRIQTVPVGDRRHVPMSEIIRITALGGGKAEGVKSPSRSRRPATFESEPPRQKGSGKPKGRPRWRG